MTATATMGQTDSFPKCLDDFGYEFNDKGELKGKDGGEFVFEVRKGDQKYNQKHYEALGECITEHVYGLLETECGLQRANVPLEPRRGDPVSFVFHSTDLQTNTDKLMVLIHGSGVVRAGQWARRLIINNNLDVGTQIPYIKRAMREGYAVIVLNTNENFAVDGDGKRVPIPLNDSPEAHAIYVWERLINAAPARQVFVVAHSYGGIVALDVVKQCVSAQQRIARMAMTDSAHSPFMLRDCHPSVQDWVSANTINWVSSELELGRMIPDTVGSQTRGYIPCVSAGHTVHEWTSATSFDAIFVYFSSAGDVTDKAVSLPAATDDGVGVPSDQAESGGGADVASLVVDDSVPNEAAVAWGGGGRQAEEVPQQESAEVAAATVEVTEGIGKASLEAEDSIGSSARVHEEHAP